MNSLPEISVDIPSSPLMMGDQSGQRSLDYTPHYYPYVLRFTPFAQDDEQCLVPIYYMENIVNEFLNHNDIELYIITQETTPKIHYHIYLESKLKHDELKKLTQTFLYSYYPVRTRGFGTKQYSCLISENPLNAIIYALKQRGKYVSSGFTEEFIDECRKQSFEKPSSDFEAELRELSDKFLNSTQDPYLYGAAIATVYSNYDKRVHWRDIQGYVNSKIIKRDPSQAIVMSRANLNFSN